MRRCVPAPPSYPQHRAERETADALFSLSFVDCPLRVGELQHSEGFRDRSPSSPQTYSSSDAAAAVLPTVEEQLEPAPSSSSTAPSSTSPRRQRAGTLPSTFHLSPSESHIPSSRHNSGSLLGLPGTTISLPASGATTPISEFAFSSALIPTPIAVPSASSTSGTAATSRLRSGSLTLPASGLATAFGPNVFSSTGWTPQEQDRLASSSNQATPSGKHDRMSAVADEVRSPGSTSFAEDSQRTLDFLGLDGDTGGFGDMIQNGAESARAQGLRSASLSVGTADAQPMQRLGSAGSLASPQLQNLAFSNQPSRIRSNTVAAFTRTPSGNQYNGGALPSSSSSFLANPISSHIPPMTTVDDFSSSTETSSSYHRSNDSSDSSRLLYATSGQDDTSSSSLLIAPTSTSTLSPSRTRAATIGILDDSKEVFMRRRAGTTTGLTPHAMQMAVGSVTGAGATGLTRGLRGLSLSQEDVSRNDIKTSARVLTSYMHRRARLGPTLLPPVPSRLTARPRSIRRISSQREVCGSATWTQRRRLPSCRTCLRRTVRSRACV